MSAIPLLRADRARVDDGGVPAVDGLTLETRGRRVIVACAPRALAEAACGQRPVQGGAIALVGRAPDEALRTRAAAFAPHEPPLPARWTVREYVAWSARLGGRGAHAAGAAEAAIERTRLAPHAGVRLEKAGPHVRRAVTLAAAIAVEAPCLVLDDPLGGLPEEAVRALAPVVADLAAAGDWIAFLPRAPLASPLCAAADELVVIDGAAVASQGAPEELAARGRDYLVRVLGDAARWSEVVRARGVTVTQDGPRLRATLPEGASPRELLAAGLEVDAVVVELRAATGAFA